VYKSKGDNFAGKLHISTSDGRIFDCLHYRPLLVNNRKGQYITSITIYDINIQV